MLLCGEIISHIVLSNKVPRVRVLVSNLDIVDDHVMFQGPDGSFLGRELRSLVTTTSVEFAKFLGILQRIAIIPKMPNLK